MNKRVLVTGMNGQVGSKIMALRYDYPFELIPIGRYDWNMASDPDIANSLVKKYKPNVVINAAAYTNVDKAEEDSKTAYAINALAVGELAKACREQNIPLLHVSTDYVFDGTKETPI